jgi:hypothetical protein
MNLYDRFVQKAMQVADEQAAELARQLEIATPTELGWPDMTAEELIESERRCWFEDVMQTVEREVDRVHGESEARFSEVATSGVNTTLGGSQVLWPLSRKNPRPTSVRTGTKILRRGVACRSLLMETNQSLLMETNQRDEVKRCHDLERDRLCECCSRRCGPSTRTPSSRCPGRAIVSMSGASTRSGQPRCSPGRAIGARLSKTDSVVRRPRPIIACSLTTSARSRTAAILSTPPTVSAGAVLTIPRSPSRTGQNALAYNALKSTPWGVSQCYG